MYSSEHESEVFLPREDVLTPGSFKVLDRAGQSTRLSPLYNKMKALIPTAPFWIAGGAITSIMTDDKINDIDIFTSDYKAVSEQLLQSGAVCVSFNAHVMNYTHPDVPHKIQLITRTFTGPLETAMSIDFTINAVAYDGENLYVHEDFVNDIESHTVNLNVIRYPFSSLKRLIKYAGRGFSPGHDALVTLVHLIREATVDDLTSQAFYIDSDPGARQ